MSKIHKNIHSHTLSICFEDKQSSLTPRPCEEHFSPGTSRETIFILCVRRAINNCFYLRVQGKNTAFRHAIFIVALFFSFCDKKNSRYIRRLFGFFTSIRDSFFSFFTLRHITGESRRTETYLRSQHTWREFAVAIAVALQSI